MRVAGRWVAVLLAVGAAATVLLAAFGSMTVGDTVELVALGAGTALAAGALAWWLLRRLRSAPLAGQLAVLTGVPIVAVVAGAWVGARAMFFSPHDLTVLGVLLVATGTVACAAALGLGAGLLRSSAAIADAAGELARGREVHVDGEVVSRELGELADRLERASADLILAQRRERALETSRRELVAWVSHDLRTPLAGIRAMAEALEDGVVDDEATIARYHAALRVEAERLAGLVDDLFELSRAQAGVIRREFDRFSLGDVVSDAVAGVGPVADAKGVRIEGHLERGAPELRGSAGDLLRALRNILENAVRHTPSDGSVVVRARREGDLAVVSVLDSGGGIAEGDLARVFDVGYRGDPARTPGGGAGLGLAIAREVVEAHDGRISVQNENGGARFELRLPVSPDDA